MPRYRADLRLFATVEVDAEGEEAAIDLMNRYFGEGEGIDLEFSCGHHVFHVGHGEDEGSVRLTPNFTCIDGEVIDFSSYGDDVCASGSTEDAAIPARDGVIAVAPDPSDGRA